MIKHSDQPVAPSKDGGIDGSQSGVESNPITQKSQDASAGEQKSKKQEEEKKKESGSIHS